MPETQQLETKQGYKKTKLGWIPLEWDIVKLEDAVIFLDNKRKPIKNADRNKRKGKYPYYGASGIIDFIDDYIFDDSLVLLGEDGANVLARSTPLAFKVTGKFWVNNHAHVLKPRKNYDIDYLTYYLESIKYDKYNTSIAQPKLNKQVCAKIPILNPKVNEQVRIGDCLKIWETGIDKLEALISSKQQLKKALMQQLLSGKKRLPGFAGEWEEKRIDQIFDEIKEKNDGGEHEPLSISAGKGFKSQREKFDRVIAGTSLSKYIQLKKGDFSYNKGNSKSYKMGCIYLLEDYATALVPFVFISFRPKNKVDSHFYKHYFINHGLDRQLKRIITSGARGDGLLNVSKKDFFKLLLPFPSIKEQTAIAEVLNTADREIQLLKTQRKQLQAQKKGLMQQLLTGKKRLKVL